MGDLALIVSPLIVEQDQPAVPSRKESCYACKEDLWVSYGIRADLPTATALCRICYAVLQHIWELKPGVEKPVFILPDERAEFLRSKW